jgi:putative flippase GtrA
MHSSTRAAQAAQGNPRLQRLAREFIQYAVVGGLSFAVDSGVFLGTLNGLGLHYLLATAIGFIAGLASNYTLCVVWVWRGTRAQSMKDFMVFTIIGVAGLGLTEIGMWIGMGLAGLGALPVKIVVAGVVLVWNFVLRKFLVFNH